MYTIFKVGRILFEGEFELFWGRLRGNMMGLTGFAIDWRVGWVPEDI